MLVLLFGVAYLVAQTAAVGTALRWGLYAIPAVSLLLAAATAGKRIAYDRRFALALATYGVLAALAWAVNPRVHFNAVRDTLIIGGYLATFLPAFPVTSRHVATLLVILVLALVPEALDPESFGDTVDFAASEGLLESVVAFPVSALALFYLTRGRLYLTLVCLALSVITFKRIALIALVAAAGFYFLSVLLHRIWPVALARRWTVILALASVSGLATLGATFDTGTEVAMQVLSIPGHPDHVTLGRYSTTRRVRALIAEGGAVRAVVGHGPGASTVLPTLDRTHNPHNDFLKISFEYGLLGLAAFVALFYVAYSGSPAALSLFVFNGFLMVTDNTLIYYFHQFVCLAAARCLRDEGSPVWRSEPARTGTVPRGLRRHVRV